MKTSKAYREPLFEAVLNAVGDGVTLIGTDFKILYQNEAITRIYGKRTGEFCYSAYRGFDSPCSDCIVKKVFRDGKSRRGIREIRLPDGNRLTIEFSSAGFRDAAGNIIGAVEAVRDVTHQKKAEALLKKTLEERNDALRQLNAELAEAAAYLKSTFPSPITCGRLKTTWQFIPSTSLGGDAFGYHWLDENRFAIYLLDVSGHGVGAALLSVSVINVLRSEALPNVDFKDPGQVLCALNDAFPGERHNDMFFTIWYGVYDQSTGILDYSSGGHPPALLYSGTVSEKTAVTQLRTPNFVIGGGADLTYQKNTIRIPPSSRLYVFSDGVFDITCTDGSIWGLESLKHFIARSMSPKESTLHRVHRHIQNITHDTDLEDDFTILEVIFR